MSSAGGAIPAAGFGDPARESQRVFRAVLDALAHPGRAFAVAGPDPSIGSDWAPGALGGGLAALLLTLLDDDVSVFLGASFAGDPDVDAWLAFHTGVRRADAGSAGFVVSRPEALPELDALAQGTEQAPHTSATVVVDVRDAIGSQRFTASGPGIDGTAVIDAPWAPPGFADQWRRNTARFPRGVDVLAVDEHQVTALPRTTRLAPTGSEA